MGGDGHHLASRPGAQLGTGRADLRPLDKLLHDATHPAELREIRLTLLARCDEVEPVERPTHCHAATTPRVAKNGIALAGKAFVQLDHRLTDSRPDDTEIGQCGQHLRLVPQILKPGRMQHPRFPEDLPAPRLGAMVRQGGVGAIQRDSQQHGELAFQRRRVEDAEIGLVGVGDRIADPLQEPGPLQDLLGERPGRRIMGAEHGEPMAGMARRHPEEVLQQVVDDVGVHRLGCHVDDAGPGVPQPDEQEEEPLLVVARAVELPELRLVQGHRRHHHRRARLLAVPQEQIPHLGQARLEPLEGVELVLQNELIRVGRLRDHAGRS